MIDLTGNWARIDRAASLRAGTRVLRPMRDHEPVAVLVDSAVDGMPGSSEAITGRRREVISAAAAGAAQLQRSLRAALEERHDKTLLQREARRDV